MELCKRPTYQNILTAQGADKSKNADNMLEHKIEFNKLYINLFPSTHTHTHMRACKQARVQHARTDTGTSTEKGGWGWGYDWQRKPKKMESGPRAERDSVILS